MCVCGGGGGGRQTQAVAAVESFNHLLIVVFEIVQPLESQQFPFAWLTERTNK